MKQFKIFLLKLELTEPIFNLNKEFNTEKEARDFIEKPDVPIVGDLWLIMRIPHSGNVYELVDSIRIP